MQKVPVLKMNRTWVLLVVVALQLSGLVGKTVLSADGEKPHIVFVVGTTHYAPQVSMPVLAKEMERFGFRTSVIIPPGEPEKNKNEVGVPGLEVLEKADVVVFSCASSL